MKKISEEQFYDLLSSRLSGDASSEQLALLQEQLILNPEWQFLNDQMLEKSTSVFMGEDETEQAYAAHYTKMQLQDKLGPGSNNICKEAEFEMAKQEPKTPVLKKFLYASLTAACIAGIMLLAQFFLTGKGLSSTVGAVNEVATKRGSRSNIKLPDGTMVWLNADSKLTYGEQFIGATREVSLVGEAYFDVAHDPLRPFVIHIGRSSIRVLGTAFNVRNYPQDNTWETTLMRGKVEVELYERPGEKIILKPMEKLVIAKSVTGKALGNTKDTLHQQQPAKTVILEQINYSLTDSAIAETSWINEQLIFINRPLGKIAEELERQFACIIVFKTPAVKNYRYSGNFHKAPLAKIFQILQLTKKINYVISGNTVTIE